MSVRALKELAGAIVRDKVNEAKRLLARDPLLVNSSFDTPKLYTSGIFHWIYSGDTPLHLAAAGHRLQLVRLLVDSGANPNAIGNSRRSTPLHYSADSFITGPTWDPDCQIRTIDCLIHAGALINAQDKNGATPLHTRCAMAVKYLLGLGSDPVIENKSGSTPFHLAVQNTGRGGTGTQVATNAQKEIIKSFLQFGVNPDLKNSRGKTVRQSVQSHWILELIPKLKSNIKFASSNYIGLEQMIKSE